MRQATYCATQPSNCCRQQLTAAVGAVAGAEGMPHRQHLGRSRRPRMPLPQQRPPNWLCPRWVCLTAPLQLPSSCLSCLRSRLHPRLASRLRRPPLLQHQTARSIPLSAGQRGPPVPARCSLPRCPPAQLQPLWLPAALRRPFSSPPAWLQRPRPRTKRAPRRGLRGSRPISPPSLLDPSCWAPWLRHPLRLPSPQPSSLAPATFAGSCSDSYGSCSCSCYGFDCAGGHGHGRGCGCGFGYGRRRDGPFRPETESAAQACDPDRDPCRGPCPCHDLWSDLWSGGHHRACHDHEIVNLGALRHPGGPCLWSDPCLPQHPTPQGICGLRRRE
mmetsp:Transcript_42250/g.106458  ORF Transcript_42250/g.106458 Transcript_42250/m.106458 type:complete len:330 (-) Transcript_42250:40-1029(-)